ncbi:MAG: EcsC family protein [Leptotrichiaceae bacterium]|nr:EcsC family protein [Leptotrichiaceae bacterium]
MNTEFDEKQETSIFDEIYKVLLNGIFPSSKSVDIIANDYLQKNETVEKAAKELIKSEILKYGFWSFIVGINGMISFPITIFLNLGIVFYIQLRMIGAVAHMGGFDIKSDQVRTMFYVCLAISGVSDILKLTGINAGSKILKAAINKISGKTLTLINRKAGFRLLTKFGTKGVINLGALIPIVGGIIGGVTDIILTVIIAKNAYNVFIKKGSAINKVCR